MVMNLADTEKERQTIYVWAEMARRKLERGDKLNHTEAAAYIADEVCLLAKDVPKVADVMEKGRDILSEEDVMEGVPEMLEVIQVEPMFPDGKKLVTIHNPIGVEKGDKDD